MSDFDRVVEQVKGIGDALLRAGWVVATPVGELSTPDRKLWYSPTYTSGEYTIHIFHREKGFGVPRGNIRVRITPALLQHRPGIGQALADDLIRTQSVLAVHGFPGVLWPPPIFAELSNEGVTDTR